MKRYFELVDEKSSKFWEVWLQDSTLFVRFGKIGANGQTSVKELPDDYAALQALDKAVADKIKRGYTEVEDLPLEAIGSDSESANIGQTDGVGHGVESWKEILPRLLQDHNAVSPDEAVNCLIGCLRATGVQRTPWGEAEALGERIVWTFPDNDDTVMWTTPGGIAYLSSLSKEYADKDKNTFTKKLARVDTNDLEFNSATNGWQYLGDLSEVELLSELALHLGAPTMTLPWQRIAEGLVENGEEEFRELMLMSEDSDQDDLEFGNILFELYSQVADNSLELPDDIYDFQYDFGDGFMPRYSKVGRFRAFLADLEDEHNWGVILDECCGTCATSSIEQIRQEKGKATSPVFVTWAQSAEDAWCLDGSVHHMAHHPDPKEVSVIKQVARKNGLSVGVGEENGTQDGFVFIEPEDQPDTSQSAPGAAGQPCPNCNSEVTFEANFCPECGSEMNPPPKFCTECGAKRDLPGKFCSNCGHEH